MGVCVALGASVVIVLVQPNSLVVQTLIPAVGSALVGIVALTLEPQAFVAELPKAIELRPARAQVTAPAAVASLGGTAGTVELKAYRMLMPLAVGFVVIDGLFILSMFASRSEALSFAGAWISALLLALWAMTACKNARALGAAQLRFTPGLAFLTMILPLATIFAGPYTFQELWQRSYGATVSPPSKLIKIAFRVIVYSVLGTIAIGVLVGVAAQPHTRHDSADNMASLGILCTLGVATGFVMRIIAVCQITARQADAFRRLSVIH